ncbi:MAG: pyridoxamine 5'-phosphate oxidase family protein [Anaerotignum sp.]|nr:pyridoxamine 5'-phosphate oxidase family protein [Anaerotignum sp.]
MQYRMKHFQLTPEQIDELLQRAECGRLGTIREDGYPYVIAMHFVYYNGNIYMHGLPKGLKVDNVNSNPKACFEVDELLGLQPGDKVACDTEAIYNSVVLTGTAQILHDIEYKREVLNRLVEKYTPQFTGKELPVNMVKGTAVIKLQVSECTGKYHK